MSKAKILQIVMPVVAVVAVATAVFFYNQASVLKKNPQAVAQEEVRALIAKVSKLVVLPTEEVPTVATVSDPEALKDQTFFANAQKGDKVLIYTIAKKAILYSPTLNKILDISPLNLGTTKTTPKAPATDAPKETTN